MNLLIARRNLFQNKTRLCLSIAGVALATMLIMLLGGFLAGMNRQIGSYLDHSPGSVVVAQKGVKNLLGANSLVPPGSNTAVKSVNGVESMIPILSQFIILDIHSKKVPAYLVGYDPKLGGGPWKLVAGQLPRNDKELILDRTLSARHNLRIGDTLEVMGKDFTITGLSDGTSSWMTSFFFMRKSAVEELLGGSQATSFLLLQLSPQANEAEVIARLDKYTGINAVSKQDMKANDIKLFARVFSMPLKLMTAIAFLVGTMIVGLVVFTSTVERRQEYGVLKAIGAGNRMLYQVVVIQAMGMALSGALLGLFMAYQLADVIMQLRPQFLIQYEPAAISRILLAGIGMALAAALFPARLIARLAPAEVFRK